MNSSANKRPPLVSIMKKLTMDRKFKVKIPLRLLKLARDNADLLMNGSQRSDKML